MAAIIRASVAARSRSTGGDWTTATLIPLGIVGEPQDRGGAAIIVEDGMEEREPVPGFERYLAAKTLAVPGPRLVNVAKRRGGGPLITLGRQGRDRGEGRGIDLLLVGEERHRRQNGCRHGGSEKH